ncbi:MAG: hypothetical protein CYPHOPRED_003943 [Cyphobasidiales sp. Tagirdzhanova-0007]|nr:MAG: hypothetical protein CYPHOPRED_003943 [Cyphobasidiales sp. Tagirdzhanova-0007]
MVDVSREIASVYDATLRTVVDQHLTATTSVDELVLDFNSISLRLDADTSNGKSHSDEESHSDAESHSETTTVRSNSSDEYQTSAVSLLSEDVAFQIRSNFRTTSGIYSSSSTSSMYDRKLLLWQSILIGFGVCAPHVDTSSASGLISAKRAKHLPLALLPLPCSTTKCVALLKAYVHVNLVDYHTKDIQAKNFGRSVSSSLYI